MKENLVEKTLNKTDFYDILNIKTDANDDQIKQAYRKVTKIIKLKYQLARQLHPDKN